MDSPITITCDLLYSAPDSDISDSDSLVVLEDDWKNRYCYKIKASSVILDLTDDRKRKWCLHFTDKLHTLEINRITLGGECTITIPDSLQHLIIRENNIFFDSRYYDYYGCKYTTNTIEYFLLDNPYADDDSDEEQQKESGIILPKIPIKLTLDSCAIYVDREAATDQQMLETLNHYQEVSIIDLMCWELSWWDTVMDNAVFYRDVIPALLQVYPDLTYIPNDIYEKSEDDESE